MNAVAGMVLLGACAGAAPARSDVVVFAAASLTEAFGEIAAAMDGVRFNFGPSDGLATQIAEGAPADVFASASSRWVDAVARDVGVLERHTFAHNTLTVIVPRANTADVEHVRDLARPGVKVVLAARGVPAGDYAREMLAGAGLAAAVGANVVSNEDDVKAVVQKVILDEADAGIVYRTDVTDSIRGRVHAIEIPDRWNVRASYEIAVVDGAPSPDGARAFVRAVLGDGQRALRAAGFTGP